MAEGPAVCKFYVAGQCRFGQNCRNSHAADVLPTPTRKIKKSKANAVHQNPAEESRNDKLPSMKTARDVIQRLLWDDEVPSQHFTVGYLDRFVGVVEQPFDRFDWTSDLASVDNQNVLAIPQHRIQYFKYRGKKLWDKNDRVDLIFGSTCSVKIELATLLRSVDDEIMFSQDLLASEDAPTPDHQACDDRPTHFLAIRIDDVKLVSLLQDAMTELASGSNDLGISRVAPELYHCTLALLTLDTVDKVSGCASVLKSIGPEIFREPPDFLELKGLSTFGDRVLFARVRTDPRLDSMFVSLVDHLKSQGLQVTEKPPEFHVTLVKGVRNVKGLDQRGITERSETAFGHQSVGFVHLCSLREAPDVDGFYRVVTSLKIPERSPSQEM